MILFQKKKLVGIFINFFIFGLWAVTFQTFDTKKGLVCRNCPLRFQRFLLGKFFSTEKIYLSVSDFELMIFVLLVKKFGRFSKTALYVSRGDFRRKKFFELKSLFSISLWIWAGDFQDSDEKCPKCQQSCILPVQTNILPKNGLEKKNSTLSDFHGKNLRISTGKCLEEIS